MARGSEDMTVHVPRDIQATLADHGRLLTDIKADLRRQGVKVDELFTSPTMALALAGHTNGRHETVQKQPQARLASGEAALTKRSRLE